MIIVSVNACAEAAYIKQLKSLPHFWIPILLILAVYSIGVYKQLTICFCFLNDKIVKFDLQPTRGLVITSHVQVKALNVI